MENLDETESASGKEENDTVSLIDIAEPETRSAHAEEENRPDHRFPPSLQGSDPGPLLPIPEVEEPGIPKHLFTLKRNMEKKSEAPLLGKLELHKGPVTKCHMAKSVIVSSALDCSVIIWSRKTGKALLKLLCNKPVHQFVHLPQSAWEFVIIAGCDDGRIWAWRITADQDHATCTRARIAILSGHLPNPVRAMAVNSTGTVLATGCCFEIPHINIWGPDENFVRGTLKVWDAKRILESVDRDEGADALVAEDIAPVAYKTMRQIVAPSLVRTSSKYNLLLGTKRPDEQSLGIRALAFAAEDRLIVVGFGYPEDDPDHNYGFKMMAVVTSSRLDTLWAEQVENQPVHHLAVIPKTDSASVLCCHLVACTSSSLHRVILGKTDRGKLRAAYTWENTSDGGNGSCAVTHDGKAVVSSGYGRISAWDAKTGHSYDKLADLDSDVTAMATSPNNYICCTGTRSGSVIVWDLEHIINK